MTIETGFDHEAIPMPNNWQSALVYALIAAVIFAGAYYLTKSLVPSNTTTDGVASQDTPKTTVVED